MLEGPERGQPQGTLTTGNCGLIQRRGLMKRIITTLIAALMVLGLLLPYVPAVSAQQETENQHATMIINRFHAVGQNEYGDPIDGQR